MLNALFLLLLALIVIVRLVSQLLYSFLLLRLLLFFGAYLACCIETDRLTSSSGVNQSTVQKYRGQFRTNVKQQAGFLPAITAHIRAELQIVSRRSYCDWWQKL
jgi:hypothetical protein